MLLGHALAGCFAVIRNWLQYILVRAGVGTGALLLFMHLLLNKAVLPLVNKTALPNIVRHVEALTLREVRGDAHYRRLGSAMHEAGKT